MITCQACGTHMNDGAIFCDRCGTALLALPRSQRATSPANSSGHGSQDGPPYAQGVVPIDTLRDTGSHVAPVTIRLALVTGQTFTLRGKYDYVVGRSEAGATDVDVNLAQSPGDVGVVSRHHLRIHVVRDGVFVEDLVSTNQTVQNGFRLQPEQWYPLHTGDILLLGGITLTVSFERP